MYLASIALLLLILPAGCVIVEALWFGSSTDLLLLVGKWLVFWAVGARLFLAGVRQVLRPQITAEQIFAIKDSAALPIMREVGFGNLAMGTLGLATLTVPAWTMPAAVVGGLYYGLAGAGHLLRGERNFAGQAAMISDFLVFAVLAAVVGLRAM
jgi:hypothetical protein